MAARVHSANSTVSAPRHHRGGSHALTQRRQRQAIRKWAYHDSQVSGFHQCQWLSDAAAFDENFRSTKISGMMQTHGPDPGQIAASVRVVTVWDIGFQRFER